MFNQHEEEYTNTDSEISKFNIEAEVTTEISGEKNRYVIFSGPLTDNDIYQLLNESDIETHLVSMSEIPFLRKYKKNLYLELHSAFQETEVDKKFSMKNLLNTILRI